MYGSSAAPTAAQVTAAARLVQQTDTTLRRYANVQAAFAAGYTYVLKTNGEEHLLYDGPNPAYQGLNPQDPSSLVYAINVPHHAPILLGAMYIMGDQQNGPQVGGGLTRWHSHLVTCVGGQQTIAGFGVQLRGGCNPGTWQDRYTSQMLHVWVVPYPGGVFSDDLSAAATSSAVQAVLPGAQRAAVAAAARGKLWARTEAGLHPSASSQSAAGRRRVHHQLWPAYRQPALLVVRHPGPVQPPRPGRSRDGSQARPARQVIQAGNATNRISRDHAGARAPRRRGTPRAAAGPRRYAHAAQLEKQAAVHSHSATGYLAGRPRGQRTHRDNDRCDANRRDSAGRSTSQPSAARRVVAPSSCAPPPGSPARPRPRSPPPGRSGTRLPVGQQAPRQRAAVAAPAAGTRSRRAPCRARRTRARALAPARPAGGHTGQRDAYAKANGSHDVAEHRVAVPGDGNHERDHRLVQPGDRADASHSPAAPATAKAAYGYRWPGSPWWPRLATGRADVVFRPGREGAVAEPRLSAAVSRGHQTRTSSSPSGSPPSACRRAARSRLAGSSARNRAVTVSRPAAARCVGDLRPARDPLAGASLSQSPSRSRPAPVLAPTDRVPAARRGQPCGGLPERACPQLRREVREIADHQSRVDATGYRPAGGSPRPR